jgi:hypothetical protein
MDGVYTLMNSDVKTVYVTPGTESDSYWRLRGHLIDYKRKRNLKRKPTGSKVEQLTASLLLTAI